MVIVVDFDPRLVGLSPSREALASYDGVLRNLTIDGPQVTFKVRFFSESPRSNIGQVEEEAVQFPSLDEGDGLISRHQDHSANDRASVARYARSKSEQSDQK